MRLTYMYYLIKENLSDIQELKLESIKTKDFRNIEISCGKISGWKAARKAMQNINTIDCFDGLIEEIFDSTSSFVEKDSFILETSAFRLFSKNIEALKENIYGILHFCEAAGFDKHKQGFDIKLPPTKDFAELAKYINTLSKIFSQCPFLNIDGEHIEIDSVDIGSIWMKFAVIATSTTIILSNLATITDKCIKIKSHIIICKQQEEQYKALQLKNDILQNIVEANEVTTNALIEQSAQELQADIGELSNEDNERLKMTLKELSELMAQGLEIYASIDTPDEIKDLFPTSDELKGLNEPIKMLTETSENNNCE